MRDDELVAMGYVSGAFGVRGWVKLHADTEHADSLFDYPVWWLGKPGQWREYRFEDGAVHTKALAAKLEGIEDRDAAFALRGLTVAIPRTELPKPADDEYYWTDLIGLAVVNRGGEVLGTVSKLMETGANDILVVQDGQVERLIPFIANFIVEVDVAAGCIVADWGLDY